MNEKRKTKISKFLSLILRHQPEEINLSLDENGWANVSELLEKSAARDFHFTFDELAEINAERMAAQNHKFYVSENGVWLVDSVPPEFLKAL